ncbi:hypothetical protein KQ941_17630 [Paenibacillus xylanexedens]|uniref:hypothetical protein n=2 Tax=Paenibacillus TaxID=44249 RepID=UPI001F2E8B84|nr:hypothetical protein [Paenibacillus xylanexedens]MCF7756265.1 hypothetical protein [Paenibacillus xylanexedens]
MVNFVFVMLGTTWYFSSLPNPGIVIITAASSDVLTLRNHSSASAVDLQTLAGGTQINANASNLMLQLSG